MMIPDTIRDLPVSDQFDFFAADVESLSDTLTEATITLDLHKEPLLRTIALGLCAVSEYLTACAEDARKKERDQKEGERT